jgi:hypothetical protein
VPADIAKSRCAQQRITQRVQDDITIGMRDQPVCVRHSNAAEHGGTLTAKAMGIKSVSDSHS